MTENVFSISELGNKPAPKKLQCCKDAHERICNRQINDEIVGSGVKKRCFPNNKANQNVAT